MISRAAERRWIKKMKKKVKDMSINEFEKLIDETTGESFRKGHEEGFDLGIKVAVSALKKRIWIRRQEDRQAHGGYGQEGRTD